MKRIWIKLSNGARTRADLVASIGTDEHTLRIFLKSISGDLLCMVQHADPDDFKAEIDSINEQLD